MTRQRRRTGPGPLDEDLRSVRAHANEKSLDANPRILDQEAFKGQAKQFSHTIQRANG